jgi:hypothetical protein
MEQVLLQMGQKKWKTGGPVSAPQGRLYFPLGIRWRINLHKKAFLHLQESPASAL